MADWDDLKTALAVAQARSMSGAARILKVDHTTVGRKLAALDERFGQPLFRREGKCLVPTTAGTSVIATAAKFEELMAGLDRTMESTRDDPDGVVRIATSEAFADFLVQSLVPFHRAHPGIETEILASNPVLDLTRGDADVAIRAAKTPHASLVTQKLVSAPWGLFGSAEYLAEHGTPETEADLTDHVLIGYEEGLRQSPGGRWFEGLGTQPRVVVRTDSIMAARAGAQVGLGLVAIPCFLGEALSQVLAGPIGMAALHLVAHPDARRVPRVAAFIEHVVEYVRSREALFLGRQ